MNEPKVLGQSLTSKERTKDVLLTEKLPFSSMLLPPDILRGLGASGFECASPIQLTALPVGRCGFDLIVKSKSGTGKTLVFSVIALESIKLEKQAPQVLILAPTREIAVQIQEVIQSIGTFFEGLTVNCFIGGLPLEIDKEKCKSCHIAVGTPGRVRQLIEQGSLKVDSIKLFVLDEADKLIEESFQNDITEIYNTLPDKKQIIMCSATYPEAVKTFLELYLRCPVVVSAEEDTPLLLGLKQFVRLLELPSNVVQQVKAKNDELLKLMSCVPFVQCIIFSNYQSRAESISNFLNRNGWKSVFISSAQKQSERLKYMSDLKDFKLKILVTTDLIARGIDVSDVNLVINYDIPLDACTYLHRMGRAGRFGSIGNCINITFNGKEAELLQNILGYIGGESLSIPVVNEKYQFEKELTHLYGKWQDSSSYDKEIQEIRKSLVESRPKKQSSKKKSKKQAEEKEELNQAVEESLSGDMSLTLNDQTSGKSETAELNAVELLEQFINVPNCKSPQKPKSVEEVVNKNKVLIDIARILSGDEVTDLNMSHCFKSQETDNIEHSKDCKSDFPKLLENIFAIAYRSQIDSTAPQWQDLLPDSEKPKLCENYQKEMSDDYFCDDEDYQEGDDCDYDEDYDFEVEKEIEVAYDTATVAPAPVKNYGFMEWIPVEPGQEVLTKKPKKLPSFVRKEIVPKITVQEQPAINSPYAVVPKDPASYNQEYQKYFQHCSGNLWQNGLMFSSVESFDWWFHCDWERQLSAVRNFVQNKIYCNEMLHYQKS
ncbi:probable ATP-dependent RNA helicase DDX20 [Euwallacea similis]|uniref:probable ATP-dependent RNA helicase DDX20 n=1 Tax=Euwallacea similis TaxID=1736056 RepID=UPI00344D950C